MMNLAIRVGNLGVFELGNNNLLTIDVKCCLIVCWNEKTLALVEFILAIDDFIFR